MDQELAALVQELLASRQEVYRKLAGLTEEQLVAKLVWGGQERNVRWLLHHMARHDREHAVQVEKNRHSLADLQSEAQMILANALVSRGELIGKLIGLSSNAFHTSPRPGERAVKEMLEHVKATDKRFIDTIEAALASAKSS